MSYRPAADLHFGTAFTGATGQLKLWDNSASAFRLITIPEGTYFFKYSNSLSDIVSVLNTLLSGYALVIRQNDRQLKWTFTDTNDYLILNSSSSEYVKAALLLGLYDNTGDTDYFLTAQVRNNYITQVTLASWFTEFGRVFETPDLRGLPSFDQSAFARQDGLVAGLSGLRRNLNEGLRLTSIDKNEVRSDWDNGTQATLFVSEDASYSASLWRAADPTYREMTFYLDAEEQTGRFWLLKPIEPKDCRPSVALWSGLFDVVVDVLFAGDELPVGFGGHQTLNDGLLCCFNLQDNAGSTYVTDATARTSGTASTTSATLYNAAGVLPGGSFAFRGGASNDYVTLNNLEAVAGLYIDYGKPFSVSMWGKPDSVTGLQLFWGNGPFTRLTSRIQLLAGGAKVGYIFAKDTASNYVLGRENVGVLSIGAWTHIVMTYNGGSAVTPASGNVKLYCGAALKTLEDWGTTGTVNGSCAGYPFYLGMYPGDTSYDYDGYLQQVCIWSRALTQAEVTALYNGGSGLAY